MPTVPDQVRVQLSRPLGELGSLEESVQKSRTKKIIAVGDEVVLSLLAIGVKPYLAVYDFSTRRAPLEKNRQRVLTAFYPNPLIAENPAGSITLDLEEKAEIALAKGGALLVKGEEDLAALVFMRLCKGGFAIMYGQPNQGVVSIVCGPKTIEKAEQFFEKIKGK